MNKRAGDTAADPETVDRFALSDYAWPSVQLGTRPA